MKTPTKSLAAIAKPQNFELEDQGPVLQNIEMLIDALATGVPTTSKYFALPIRCLADLNHRLVTPIAHKMKRPQLKTFPTLVGLFLLLRASGLAVGETKPKRVVLIDPEMREKWGSLNSTEQYMSLMDAWWTKISWTMLGEGDPFSGKFQSDTRNLYYQLLRRPDVNIDRLFFGYETRTTAALLEQFGWIKVTHAKEAADGKVAEMRSIKRTDFGDAMFTTLHGTEFFEEPDASKVKQELKSLFPSWKNSLLPAERPFREGRYKLKLSWSDVWRRLETPANTSLEDVTAMLLSSFDFEQDHLYRLDYREPSGQEVFVEDPSYDDAQRFADEIRLGDVPLDIGDSIGLLFDFGDSWRFTIKIEDIDESATDDFEPQITASHGESPKQYDFDDEDDYEDEE